MVAMPGQLARVGEKWLQQWPLWLRRSARQDTAPGPTAIPRQETPRCEIVRHAPADVPERTWARPRGIT